MANFDDQIRTQIKIISQCFVSPKNETQASKQPYFLGPFELVFLRVDPIQRGFLFSSKPKNIQTELLETLKKSIAIALVYFYPLAGQFSTQELPDDNAKWVYLDCTKGPGAGLVHASVDETVSNILTSVDVHPIVRLFFDVGEKSINYDGHTRPLLSVQVTELLDGIFIGFTINHSVVDGTSGWHFMNSLSEIFLELTKNQDNQNNNDTIPTISQNPVFQPYFPEGWGPILKLPNANNFYKSITQKDTTTIRSVLLRDRIFHFSSESVRKLKAKANEECGVNNISSFQALSGFIWRSITRARNLDSKDETCFGLVMNSRPRFNPPLSNNYFGNLIVNGQTISKVGELLDKGLGSAAMLVHLIVVSHDDKRVRGINEGLVKFLCEDQSGAGSRSPFHSPNIVMMGGSAWFNMYGPEFGLGKAVAGLLTGYSGKEDGKVTVNPGREGGGSVALEVSLDPGTMKALELNEEFISFVTPVPE